MHSTVCFPPFHLQTQTGGQLPEPERMDLKVSVSVKSIDSNILKRTHITGEKEKYKLVIRNRRSVFYAKKKLGRTKISADRKS
jgi:hypothetical protein